MAAHTPNPPPFLWIRCLCMLLNLCFCVCSVIRDLSSTPSRCTRVCVHLLKVTHPHTTFPYPPPQQPRKTMPSLHMSSIADACSLLADDCRRWTQCLFIVVAPCTVRNRNTGLVLASLRCCSRRRSERGTTPPCCGVPAP